MTTTAPNKKVSGGDKSGSQQQRKVTQSGNRVLSDEEADRRAWAIVNKQDYGSKKSGQRTKHSSNEEQ